MPNIDLRSPLITGLSLSLLLRANDPFLPAIAGFIAIASKFVLRIDGRHIFNPAGFAIVVLLLTSNGVWISPGQWGTGIWLAALIAFFAILVLQASQRSDMALFFLGSHAALLVARAHWLGDPLAIPLHQLQSGSLLIFTFFMISDPKTTPDSRFGRLLFACGGSALCPLPRILHANPAGALFRADRPFPAHAAAQPDDSGGEIRVDSNRARSISMTRKFSSRLKAGVALAAILAQIATMAGPASAFCGFYVAKADTKLFNKSSKVVIARDGDQTVITMASDYEGKPDDFALVVPVPTFIEKDEISVVDTKTIDHLDAYTAPRLVEYYDENPCEPIAQYRMLSFASAARPPAAAAPSPAAYPGVTVEARYDVAEYDISILSAQQSDGLIQWLNDNGYKIPPGAEPVIGSYIKQNMHFFVAKVNVKRMNENGGAYLRPLQVRYGRNKFMLPLRLGTRECQRAAGSDRLRLDAARAR